MLIDPWTRSLSGPLERLANEIGYRASAPDQACAYDNAERMPRCRVVDVQEELRRGAAIMPGPDTPLARTVLYEAHVKALTALHPGVPAALRGTYAGLASPAMLAHYQRLGLTALCLLPVQLHVDEHHLIERGMTNHWGYNTLAFFVPDPRYATVPVHDAPGLHLYGSEAAQVQQCPGMANTLGHGLTEAMVRYAARFEYAQTVEDVLARRSRLVFLDARKAIDLAPAVADILRDELGADPHLDAFLALAQQYLHVPA